MNGLRARVVAILFLIVLLLLMLLVPPAGTNAETAFQMSFGWAIKLIGGTIAVLAAVEICFLAIQQRTQDLPLVITVLLAGLALTSPAWPIVLGLAALAICQIVLPALQGAGGTAKTPAAPRRKTTTRKK